MEVGRTRIIVNGEQRNSLDNRTSCCQPLFLFGDNSTTTLAGFIDFDVYFGKASDMLWDEEADAEAVGEDGAPLVYKGREERRSRRRKRLGGGEEWAWRRTPTWLFPMPTQSSRSPLSSYFAFSPEGASRDTFPFPPTAPPPPPPRHSSMLSSSLLLPPTTSPSSSQTTTSTTSATTTAEATSFPLPGDVDLMVGGTSASQGWEEKRQIEEGGSGSGSGGGGLHEQKRGGLVPAPITLPSSSVLVSPPASCSIEEAEGEIAYHLPSHHPHKSNNKDNDDDVHHSPHPQYYEDPYAPVMMGGNKEDEHEKEEEKKRKEKDSRGEKRRGNSSRTRNKERFRERASVWSNNPRDCQISPCDSLCTCSRLPLSSPSSASFSLISSASFFSCPSRSSFFSLSSTSTTASPPPPPSPPLPCVLHKPKGMRSPDMRERHRHSVPPPSSFLLSTSPLPDRKEEAMAEKKTERERNGRHHHHRASRSCRNNHTANQHNKRSESFEFLCDKEKTLIFSSCTFASSYLPSLPREGQVGEGVTREMVLDNNVPSQAGLHGSGKSTTTSAKNGQNRTSQIHRGGDRERTSLAVKDPPAPLMNSSLLDKNFLLSSFASHHTPENPSRLSSLFPSHKGRKGWRRRTGSIIGEKRGGAEGGVRGPEHSGSGSPVSLTSETRFSTFCSTMPLEDEEDFAPGEGTEQGGGLPSPLQPLPVLSSRAIAFFPTELEVRLRSVTGLRLGNVRSFRCTMMVTQTKKVLCRTREVVIDTPPPPHVSRPWEEDEEEEEGCRCRRRRSSMSSSSLCSTSSRRGGRRRSRRGGVEAEEERRRRKRKRRMVSRNVLPLEQVCHSFSAPFRIPQRFWPSLAFLTFTLVISTSKHGLSFDDCASCTYCLNPCVPPPAAAPAPPPSSSLWGTSSSSICAFSPSYFSPPKASAGTPLSPAAMSRQLRLYHSKGHHYVGQAEIEVSFVHTGSTMGKAGGGGAGMRRGGNTPTSSASLPSASPLVLSLSSSSSSPLPPPPPPPPLPLRQPILAREKDKGRHHHHHYYYYNSNNSSPSTGNGGGGAPGCCGCGWPTPTTTNHHPLREEEEEVMDELALLCATWQPSLLHQLDILMHRSGNMSQLLPTTLPRMLIGLDMVGTCFLGVQAIALKSEVISGLKPIKRSNRHGGGRRSGAWGEQKRSVWERVKRRYFSLHLSRRKRGTRNPTPTATGGGGAMKSGTTSTNSSSRLDPYFYSLSTSPHPARSSGHGHRQHHHYRRRRHSRQPPQYKDQQHQQHHHPHNRRRRRRYSSDTSENGSPSARKSLVQSSGAFSETTSSQSRPSLTGTSSEFSPPLSERMTTTTAVMKNGSWSPPNRHGSSSGWSNSRLPDSLSESISAFPGMILVASGRRWAGGGGRGGAIHRTTFSSSYPPLLPPSPLVLNASPTNPSNSSPPPLYMTSVHRAGSRSKSCSGCGGGGEEAEERDYASWASSSRVMLADPNEASFTSRPRRPGEGGSPSKRRRGTNSRKKNNLFLRNHDPGFLQCFARHLYITVEKKGAGWRREGGGAGGGGRGGGGGVWGGVLGEEEEEEEMGAGLMMKAGGGVGMLLWETGKGQKRKEGGGGTGTTTINGGGGGGRSAAAAAAAFFNGGGCFPHPEGRRRRGSSFSFPMAEHVRDIRPMHVERELGLLFDLIRVDLPGACRYIPPLPPSSSYFSSSPTYSSDSPPAPSSPSLLFSTTYSDPIVVRLWYAPTPYRTKHGKEIGRTVISIRALLTESIYAPCTSVTLPLVSVTEKTNRVGVSFVGYIKLVVKRPKFSPPLSPYFLIRVPPGRMSDFSRSGAASGDGKPRRKKYGGDGRLDIVDGVDEAEEEDGKRSRKSQGFTTIPPPTPPPPPSSAISSSSYFSSLSEKHLPPSHASNNNASVPTTWRSAGELARWYFDELKRFGEEYDPGMLLDLHYLVFEVFLQQPQWPHNVESYFQELVQQWGK